jgi:hypothetical protein
LSTGVEHIFCLGRRRRSVARPRGCGRFFGGDAGVGDFAHAKNLDGAGGRKRRLQIVNKKPPAGFAGGGVRLALDMCKT